MTLAEAKHPLVLAIHPTRRGLGWAVFEGPFAPVDWGSIEPRNDKNRKCLAAAERLFERLRPAVLVLERYGPCVKRAPRIARLVEELTDLAADMGAQMASYPRTEVQDCFSHLGSTTRHGVASSVALCIPAFAALLPPARKAWETEPRALCIFAAAALAFTHYAARSNDLLNRLKGEATPRP